MQLEATITYEETRIQTKRVNLLDFFHLTHRNFKGYAESEQFRKVLTEAFKSARRSMVVYGLTDQPVDTIVYSGVVSDRAKGQTQKLNEEFIDNRFRAEVLNEVSMRKWLQVQTQQDAAKKARDEAKMYLMAGATEAGKDIVVNFTGGKIKKYGGRYIGKMIAKGEVNSTFGKVSAKMVMGSHGIKYKPEKWSNALIDVRLNATERAVGNVADAVTSDSKGIDTSFNNDDTRRYYSQLLGVNEEKMGSVLEKFDKVTDFIPIFATVKTANKFVSNAYVAGVSYWSSIELDRTQKENEEQWKEMENRLKKYIHADISSLTGEELRDLCNLLGIKQ